MIQSNDGGANVSLDGGRTWSTQANQPTAEIYQVAVDNQYPYRVYGAQQDNTTVIVPSLPLGNGQDFRVGPGLRDRPHHSRHGQSRDRLRQLQGPVQPAESEHHQRRALLDRRANRSTAMAAHDLIYRFQRVSPMEVSPHDPQRGLLRLAVSCIARAMAACTWEKISPDLTAHPRRHAGRERRADHARCHRRRGLQHAVLDSRIARAEGRDLDRIERRPDLRHARRRQDLDQRDAGRTCRPAAACRTSSPARIAPGTAYAAIYRFLLGDFAPYIYRTDDFGKTWTLLTDGKNGIAADEPTRVVREDPDRAGLLYAGTEFGMYISFDNGAHWQIFQLNLPVTPVTDIKIAHKDLVLSTQGPLVLDSRQPDAAAPARTTRCRRRGVPVRAARSHPHHGARRRRTRRGDSVPARRRADRLLPRRRARGRCHDGDSGRARARWSASSRAPAPAAEERPGRRRRAGSEDEEGGFRMRSGPTRLDKTPGMHRFTWDLRYPGPWMSARVRKVPTGRRRCPGKYSVRLTVGSWTATQPLTVIEDPRVTKDGVTTADLREQFEHNMRVRDLVSDVNRTVARLRARDAGASERSGKLAKLNELAAHLITPPIRYSKPELQTHITYLYTRDQRHRPEDRPRRDRALPGPAQGTGPANEGVGRNPEVTAVGSGAYRLFRGSSLARGASLCRSGRAVLDCKIIGRADEGHAGNPSCDIRRCVLCRNCR